MLNTKDTSITTFSLHELMDDLHRRSLQGNLTASECYPTGIRALDRRIAGGLRKGNLFLLGGGEGAGKTTFALQIARNMAIEGVDVIYICYEHSEEELMLRLISMESARKLPNGDVVGLRLSDLYDELRSANRSPSGALAKLEGDQYGRLALEKMEGYASRFRIAKASSSSTDLDVISRLVDEHIANGSKRLFLVIDYLQKIYSNERALSEEDRTGKVVEGLKDLALSREVPILAIVAADKEGIRARRLRSYHLRGSSALLYEADLIIVMNEKSRIVSRQAVDLTAYKAIQMSGWVVFSIEKNRLGRDLVDFQLKKMFNFSMFDPSGDAVPEPLVDDTVHIE